MRLQRCRGGNGPLGSIVVRQEFATYYPLADLMRWLVGDPFIEIGRHAAVNLQAIEHFIHRGDRHCRVRLCDRVGTELTASRTGAARIARSLEDATLKGNWAGFSRRRPGSVDRLWGLSEKPTVVGFCRLGRSCSYVPPPLFDDLIDLWRSEASVSLASSRVRRACEKNRCFLYQDYDRRHAQANFD